MPLTPNSEISEPTHSDEEATDSKVPTFGPPRKLSRKPRQDDLLLAAVDQARSALEDVVPEGELGQHLSATTEDERLVTHRFAAHTEGYRGWEWYVTLARAPRSKHITVCEFGLLPGEDALLAPPWVPWMERASEEERVRLHAISEGVDPSQALREAGLGPQARATTGDAEPAVDESVGDVPEKAEATDDADSSGHDEDLEEPANSENLAKANSAKTRSRRTTPRTRRRRKITDDGNGLDDAGYSASGPESDTSDET